MAKIKVQANEIASNDGGRTIIGNILSNSGFTPLADLDGGDYPTVDNLNEIVIPEATPAPIIRVLTAGQTVPYSFTLPSNFNGKYQMSVKIDRGGGIWENYPDAKVQDLLDMVTSGGIITDYFVNRVDLYGNESGGVNLDTMIFTFSKG